MSGSDPTPRYPTAVILMHWAIAAAVVGLIASSLR
jgi:cytochrome b561